MTVLDDSSYDGTRMEKSGNVTSLKREVTLQKRGTPQDNIHACSRDIVRNIYEALEYKVGRPRSKNTNSGFLSPFPCFCDLIFCEVRLGKNLSEKYYCTIYN